MSEVPATYVKFNGANASLDDDPEISLGDRVQATVYGECVRVATEKRSDGERRPVITVKVDDVELGDIVAAPKDEQLPFDEDAPSLGSDT